MGRWIIGYYLEVEDTYLCWDCGQELVPTDRDGYLAEGVISIEDDYGSDSEDGGTLMCLVCGKQI